MISFVKGRLAAVYEGRAVVEVNGVGFDLQVSMRDVGDMPAIGQEVKMHTYMSVTQDAITLFGFLSEDDMNVYKKLITVSGVGPKAALSILGIMSANDIRFAVFSDDAKAIAKAPGIGNKTAQKVILELKDKLKLEDALEFSSGADVPAQTGKSAAADADIADAVQALVALGYTNSDALRAVRSVAVTEGMDSGDILKLALKNLM